MPRGLSSTVFALASLLLGGCLLGPGSRAPVPRPDPPAQGPRFASGGQRLSVTVSGDASIRARAALLARGWTVVASTRPDEVLGVIHDNVAVLRWGPEGWWAKVTQRSDLRTQEQVATWDHPWEALRLLHLAEPSAGPADGWQRAEDPGFLAAAEAEPLYVHLLAEAALGIVSDEDPRLLQAVQAVQSEPSPDQIRRRLAATLRLAATMPVPAAIRKERRHVAVGGLIQARLRSEFLIPCSEGRRDPFTVLSATSELSIPEPARAVWLSAPWSADHLIEDIVVAWRAGWIDRAPHLWPAEIALLLRLAPPGFSQVTDAEPIAPTLVAIGDRDARQLPLVRWWREHGRSWCDRLASEEAE